MPRLRLMLGLPIAVLGALLGLPGMLIVRAGEIVAGRKNLLFGDDEAWPE